VTALGRRVLPLALPLMTAAAIVLIVHGVSSSARATKSDAGTVPVSRVPTSTSSESWQPQDARTVPAGSISIAPEPSASGARASEAGNPIGNNPVPIRLVRLEIPALDVSAHVVNVGVAADAQLEIPSDPQMLGRWSGGAEPGEPYGSTVVVGHVDTARENGALFALHRMHLGDHIVAVGADGRRVTYQVVASREVAKAQLATSLEPFRQDVQERLVIVTCGGTFDPVHHHYADNIVVFAVPIGRS
jgi:hypothetical protein